MRRASDRGEKSQKGRHGWGRSNEEVFGQASRERRWIFPAEMSERSSSCAADRRYTRKAERPRRATPTGGFLPRPRSISYRRRFSRRRWFNIHSRARAYEVHSVGGTPRGPRPWPHRALPARSRGLSVSRQKSHAVALLLLFFDLAPVLRGWRAVFFLPLRSLVPVYLV